MKVGGQVRVPGDKSITHRALLLAAMARGASHIGGALTSLDARSSARVLRALGAEITPLRAGEVVTVRGAGRLRRAERTLDCGNSGTTTRLLLGLLAGHRFPATLTGDASLRRRPMRRVTVPLAEMGARFEEDAGDGLPLTIRGGPLRPLRYAMPVSSAQIKSALLLAGVAGGVEVELLEPSGRSRDHTERMLRHFGFDVGERDWWIRFRPGGRIEPFDLQVPGDPSSAVFLVAAALLAEAGELRIAGVGVNPTRIGFLDVLARMGGPVEVEDPVTHFGEPVADLLVRPAGLRATEVAAGEVPGLIDEIPMLAVLASRAEGTTVFRQVGELRVKESDRLGLVAANLRAVGAEADVVGDDLFVTGGETPPRGPVRTAGDHRLAMAFAVLGTLPGARVRVDDMACAAVSFPDFPSALRAVGRRAA
ncbi:MAG: 3-phosphoshikimate 1-carboxyvinyltransferase [Gemmatimonadales bacterium]|nr:3-phosphoshikimate 1-carboxyvinyltransferase [Gemmatimonadales bacterium]MBA3553832.1 3-phosphoshikimate 1-carboxyvinyltransferase [Gemmatimonadales bacterium]